MNITVVFIGFAALFSLAGWLMPHLVHRLGYRMALFYLLMAAISAVLTLARRPDRQ